MIDGEKPRPCERRELALKWLSERGADLRARTQAEYLYTAGALAMFGGVAWGILPLHRRLSGMVAAAGILLVALFIDKKICHDHQRYDEIWIGRAKIAKELDPNNSDAAIIAPAVKNCRSGSGYGRSRRVVWIAAGVTAFLCLAGPDHASKAVSSWVSHHMFR